MASFDSLALLNETHLKEVISIALKEKDCIHVQPEIIGEIKSLLKIDDRDAENIFRSLTALINRCLVQKESTHAIVEAVFPNSTENSTSKQLLEQTIREAIESYKQTNIYSQPLVNDFRTKLVNGTQPNCLLTFNLNCGNGTEDDQRTVNVAIERQQLSQIIEGMSKIRRQLFNAAENR